MELGFSAQHSDAQEIVNGTAGRQTSGGDAGGRDAGDSVTGPLSCLDDSVAQVRFAGARAAVQENMEGVRWLQGGTRGQRVLLEVGRASVEDDSLFGVQSTDDGGLRFGRRMRRVRRRCG